MTAPLRVIPLGGLGEIGLNSMLIELGDEMILVDAGLLFPDSPLFGVDYLVPDFAYVRSQAHRLKAVLLTHAHEDHVGALQHLLRDVRAPVLGSPFTVGVGRARVDEAAIPAEFRSIGPGEPQRLSDLFTVEAVRVCHSVPDAYGYLIGTPAGTLVHSGDFKLDPDPPDGHPTDLTRLTRAGDEGVLCLFSDSTNSEIHVETGSEHAVGIRLHRAIAEAGPRRIIISLFASNVYRLQAVCAAAEKAGRKVALGGRSMERNVQIARREKLLDAPEDLFVPLEAAASLPKEKVVVLATGSQAEPRATLSLMLDENRAVHVQPGDLVILSARPIPGNERAVGALVDQLTDAGATVLHGSAQVSLHVSGHASKPQQRRLLEAVRPRSFVPIHGELRHLHAHCATAREVGLGPDHVLLARDGEVIEFDDAGRARRSGVAPAGRVLHDRFGEATLRPDAVTERRRMAELGAVFAAVVLDGPRGIAAGPFLTGRGLNDVERAVMERAALDARAFLAEVSPELLNDDQFAADQLVLAVRRAYKQFTAKRPQVVPQVIR
ncbi:MAG TPA: ribonuclease J, partial [Myxococcales bacterium]|nr:ribonuclease J [Myxococcales bacterium]